MKLTHDELMFFNKCAKEVLSLEQVQGMTKYVQHGKTNCLEHSIAVAYYSFLICRRWRLDRGYRSLIRGALLHDFFLYDWRDKDNGRMLHGFTHPADALRNASLYFRLNEVERDIIAKHMWPMTIKLPKYRLALIVSVVDKVCATIEFFHSRRIPRSYKNMILAGD